VEVPVIGSGRIALVVASAAAPGAAAALSDEHTQLVSVLVATVAVVAGLIAWIDRRIDKRVKAHEAHEAELDDERHAALLGEIRHVRELLRLPPEDRDITGPIPLTGQHRR
jgi:hypothetical protein